MSVQFYGFLADSLSSTISFYGELAEGHGFLAEPCGAGILPGLWWFQWKIYV